MKNNSQFSGSSNYKYYASDLTAMSFAVNYHKNIIRQFSKYLGDSILEIGAGTGNLADILLENKYEFNSLTLVEPDEEVFKLLKSKYVTNKKVKVIKAFTKDIKDMNNCFSSVIYNNVLEHIEDDISEIANVKKLLKKDGYVCIYSPAGRILYSKYDHQLGHYRRYTLKEKRTLLEKNNLKCIDIKHSDLIGYFLWLVKYKILGFKGSNDFANSVKFFDKHITPINEFIESKIKLPFGKNILVIGKKV